MPDETPKVEDKEPDLELEEMLVKKTKRYTKDCESGSRWRTAMAVTLFKRYMNDYHGYWDAQVNSWLDVPSQGLMKWPILGPIVRSNNANWLATRIKLEIEAASSEPRTKGAETIAEAVYDYLYTRDWTETNEELMSLYCQLGFNYAIYSGFSKSASSGKIKIPKVKTETVEGDGPEWYCSSCGNSGPGTDLATEEGQQLSGAVPCPACKEKTAYLDDDKQDEKQGAQKVELHDGYDEVDEGDNFTKVIPSLLFMVDEVNSKAGDSSGAHWVNYNRLVRRYEAKALYGKAAENLATNDGREWLDSVKWWHALESGATVKEDRDASSRGGGKQSDDDLLQERHWWLVPSTVKGWKSPANLDHPCGFKIKKGQTFAEAFKAMGKKFVGLYLCMIGKKVMYIDSERHRDCWTGGLWLMNGASYWGKAQQELLDIQEAANEWFTMFFEYGERSSLPTTIIDGEMFDKKDFNNTAGGICTTRKGFRRQHPIRWYVERLEPARLSGDLIQIFSALKDGAQEISGVSRASIGQGDTANKTLGGQALLTQRSQGLMIPSQKSKKRAQVNWTRHQLKFVQTYWSDERIKRVLSKSDRSWDDQDIAAFRAIDVDRDLKIEGAEGSDIPITFAEREAKLIQIVASGVLWNPQIPVQLREQIAHFGGIDYSPENIESERRHQMEVLHKIEGAVQWVETQGLGYVAMPDGSTTLNPQAVQQIQTMPGLEILPRSENLTYAISFFNNYVVALHTAEHPDALLLAVLQARVDQLIAQNVTNINDAAQAAKAIEGQPGGKGGKDPKAEAEENDKDRAHQVNMTQLKHEHAKELQQMKAGDARDAEMGSKVPPAPSYSAFAD